jgi:peptidoglycan-N-acetylglucosamine deacetylase
MKPNPMALSFDIEDWFTVRNMREVINESEWDNQEYRIEIGVNYILEQLNLRNIKATFFILGWVAQRSPELVAKIHQHGHEIASHGHSHKPIDLMTPKEFREDLQKSITLLEEITGEKIKGFRAPSFSLTKKTAWAIEIMKELGLEYDSSIFVTSHPDYGVIDFPEEIVNMNGLIEVPMIKGKLLSRKIPVNGGGYFRLFPYAITKNALLNNNAQSPMVLYFHPWEFDKDQPRAPMSPLKRFRHYVGLSDNRLKFERLLDDFDFCTIRELIENSPVKSLERNPLLPQLGPEPLTHLS